MEEIRKDCKWLSKVAFQCSLIFVFAIILSHLFCSIRPFKSCARWFISSLLFCIAWCYCLVCVDNPTWLLVCRQLFETASHPPSKFGMNASTVCLNAQISCRAEHAQSFKPRPKHFAGSWTSTCCWGHLSDQRKSFVCLMLMWQ